MVLSSNRTTLQVDQATHTEAFADFAPLLAAGREESAQQPMPAKLLDLNCQLWALRTSRSKISASSAEIDAFLSRKSRPGQAMDRHCEASD